MAHSEGGRPVSRRGERRRDEKEDREGAGQRLQDQVNHPALFRTPDSGCSRGAQSEARFAESVKNGRLLTLNDQIAHLFPTPRTAGGMTHPLRAPEKAREHRWRLEDYVALFPTPKATDADHGGRGRGTRAGT